VLADALAYVWDGNLEWYQPGDGEYWYVEKQNDVVRTPVGMWYGREYDDGDETEQATLETYD